MTTVRRKAKARADVTARYDAGGTGRRIARWNPPTTGPQKALQGFEKMRSRVHDAVRNDWAAESSTQKWVTNLIGTGIQPRFKNSRHRAIWDKFAKQSDADGVLDIYGQQVLGGRALFDGGEVFLRRRPRDLTAPLDVPVQVQLIEGEFCPMFDATAWPGMPVGNTINQGIERNRFGRRTAYWFYREHPGDGLAQPGKGDLIRVAASEVSHVYEVKRPGQLRGVSPLASILVRLREIGDWEGASLDRVKLANLFAMFITRPMPDADDVDINPLTGLPAFYDTTGQQMAGLESGIAQELRPGEDVKFANPPGVGVGHNEFLRSGHLGTAAGQGLPYELMSGDIKDVSDRTLRVVIQEFRRFCQQRQWITLIPQMCQRTVEWCMDAAALAGLLPLSQLDAAKAPTWTPQGWDYIHPTQDAQGKKILLDMGVISKTSIIVERGDEPGKVFEERASDSEEEDRLGIKQAADGTLLEDAPAPVAPVAPAPAPKQQASAEPTNAQFWERVLDYQARTAAPPNNDAVEKTLNALVDVIAAMQSQAAATGAAIQALALQLAERPLNIAAPVVNVTNEPAVTNVAAPVVNIEPAVTNVTVEPAVTNVAAPIVNVAAADVTVDVNLPERETTSRIKRDSAGNIIDVTQTERTVQ